MAQEQQRSPASVKDLQATSVMTEPRNYCPLKQWYLEIHRLFYMWACTSNGSNLWTPSQLAHPGHLLDKVFNEPGYQSVP
jgi:hypothetical protein